MEANNATAVAVLDETEPQVIEQIQWSALRVAPWNARKTFDETALADLTASVQKSGIVTPLIVRPLDAVNRFEIVAGHRRHMAAQSAGLFELPCLVRDMTDEEAREIGMVENLQRADLHPLEEAAGYAQLMNAPGATVATVAARLGKADSHVARRLRLLDAAQEVRDALLAGAIEVGHALELARLETKQQIDLLQRMNVVDFNRNEDDFDNENEIDEEDDETGEVASDEKAPQSAWRPTAMSVAELKRVIEKTTLHVLSDAPFPLEDEIPPMSCAECPKRSGNATQLFEDYTQDTCTDRSCYDGKIRAWVRFSLEESEKQGKKLLPLSESYNHDKSIIQRWDVTVIDSDKITPCDKQEEAIWIDGPRAGHAAVICRSAECKIHRSGNRGSSTADLAKQKADRRAQNQHVKAQKNYRAALFNAIATKPIGDMLLPQFATDVALYCIARMTSIYNRRLAEAFGWDPKILDYGHTAKLREKLLTLTPTERLRAAALASHAGELAVQEYNLNSKPSGFETLATYLAIDTKALLTEVSKQAEPKTKPAKAVKKETEPKKTTTAKNQPEPKKEPEPKKAASKSKPATPKKPAPKKTAPKKVSAKTKTAKKK